MISVCLAKRFFFCLLTSCDERKKRKNTGHSSRRSGKIRGRGTELLDLAHDPLAQLVRPAQIRTVTGVVRLDVPLDVTGLKHGVLSNGRDAVVLQGVQVGPSSVVERVGPGWRTAGRFQRILRLISDFRHGYAGLRFGDVVVEDFDWGLDAELTVSLEEREFVSDYR